MQAQVLVPLFVCLLGLIIWLIVSAPITRSAVGQIAWACFQCGLLVTLFVFAGRLFRL